MKRLSALLAALTPSVNRRIVFGLVGSVLACLWCFVGFWSWWEHSSIISANARVQEQLTAAVQAQARSLFKQAETSLTVARHWMAEHPEQDPATAPGFIQLVESLRRSSDNLIDIRLVARDGTLRYVPDRGQAQQTKVSDRDYFQAQFNEKTRGFFVAQPVVSRVTGKLGLPISMPVDQAGGNIAVIFAAIELHRITGFFEAERPKPGGTIAMIRDDGLFLFRSPMEERLIGSSLAQSAAWTEQISPSSRGLFDQERSPVDGRARIVSYTRVPDYPLIVAVTTARDDLLAPWRLHAGLLVLVAVIVSGFCILLGASLLRAMKNEAVARQELEQLMLTDPLTGAGNRRMLMLRLHDEIQRAQRYRRPLIAVFFDLDHFKRVNDTYGHDVGDIVLTAVARRLRANVRQSDHLARFGGEEFVVVLPETTLEDAFAHVERMRLAVAQMTIPELPGHITLSAGLAQWREGESDEALLRRADQALYHAKEAGRNSTYADTRT